MPTTSSPATPATPFSRSPSPSHATTPLDEVTSSSSHKPSDVVSLSPLCAERPLLYLPPPPSPSFTTHTTTPLPEKAPELMQRRGSRRTTRPSTHPTASNAKPSSNATSDTNERPMSPNQPHRRPRRQPPRQFVQPSEALTSSSHNSDGFAPHQLNESFDGEIMTMHELKPNLQCSLNNALSVSRHGSTLLASNWRISLPSYANDTAHIIFFKNILLLFMPKNLATTCPLFAPQA
ncbi:hypothetical protein V6Z11_A06G151400 [Gossypium hirsutum]